MSTTSFGINDPLTNKVWGKVAFKDSVKMTLFGKLMGKKDTSIVQIKDELGKAAGDRARFRLRALPSGAGKTGSETLEGNEEGLEFSYFDITIDQLRHATKVDLGANQQRVDFSLRTEAKEAMSEWWAENLDTYMFRALSSDTTFSFAGNTPAAPSTGRIIYGGNATSKASIDSSDTFDLNLIDKAVETAKLATPTMRKANFGGKKAYVMILHPYQVYDLRVSTSTGQWLDIQKAAMQGGKVTGNPIFDEALGVYNGVCLIESTRIRTFSDYGAGADVSAARALFLGAQAGAVAFGKGHGMSRMKWTEKTFDYGDKLGVAGACIWGVAKTKFSGVTEHEVDFGVIAVDTAAAAHA